MFPVPGGLELPGRRDDARPWIAALPPLLALLVFAPALGGGFVHDDAPQIVRNPMVQDARFLPALWSTGVWAGAGSGSSWYRPLMTTSFAVDRLLLGPGPLGFHATQLALYSATIALLVALLHGLGASPGQALLAGSLAAVHPVQAETVAWISARGDLLAAAAGFAALLLLDRRLRAAPGRGAALAAAAGLAFFLALAAKESAVAFAPAFLALDRVHAAPSGARAWATRHAGWLAGALLYAILRRAALGDVSGGLLAPLDARVALGFLGQGVVRLLWPIGLTIAPPPPGALEGAAGIAFLALAAGAGAGAWRRRAPALVPLVLLAASLAVAALGAGRVGELGDRYLLVPACAGAWLVAGALAALPAGWQRPARAAAAAGIGALALLSIRHVSVYRSDETLWRDAWEKNPRALRAPLNLAAWHLERGEPAPALAWLDRAEALAPADPQVALNRAVAAEQLGDRAEARRLLAGLLARDAGAWPARLRLAHLELDAGHDAEAAALYEAVVRVHPLAAEAWAGLGVARHRQRRDAEARAALDRALALDPAVQNADALRQLRDRLAP
jgi:tetratricopeptide (TPR) repeat protein